MIWNKKKLDNMIRKKSLITTKKMGAVAFHGLEKLNIFIYTRLYYTLLL